MHIDEYPLSFPPPSTLHSHWESINDHNSRQERRHGSTRVPGHAFLVWNSSWRMVVYIYNITAADNSISSQQGNRYGTQNQGAGPSITYKITPAGSLSSSQQGGPSCWASPLASSPLALGLIGAYKEIRWDWSLDFALYLLFLVNAQTHALAWSDVHAHLIHTWLHIFRHKKTIKK